MRFSTVVSKVIQKVPGARKLLTEIKDLSLSEASHHGPPKRSANSVELFQSFNEAAAQCRQAKGYEGEQLVRTIVEKQKVANKELYQNKPLKISSALAFTSVALSYVESELRTTKLDVIDFGGGPGGHFSVFRRIFGSVREWSWRVVETQKMVEMCNIEESLKPAKFYSTLSDAIGDAVHINLLYMSGALQYLPDPYATLQEIIDLAPDYVFFNRTAFTTGPHDIIGIQKSRLRDNGAQVELPGGIEDLEIHYPFIYIQKSKFDEIIHKNFELVMEMPEESGFHMVNEEPIVGNAMLFKKRIN